MADGARPGPVDAASAAAVVAVPLPARRPAPGPGADGAARQRDVDQLMAARRWAEAAALLDEAPASDTSAARKLRLSRNMLALQEHQPRVYESLWQAPPTSACRLVEAPDGNLTIAQTRPGHEPCLLSAGRAPGAALAALAADLRQPARAHQPAVLLGVADGHLLSWLAANPAPHPLGMEFPVYITEPHPEVLVYALMIHDWTGSAGPIRQPRFLWAVGPDWDAQLQQLLRDDPMLLLPTVEMRLSALADEMGPRFGAARERVIALGAAAQRQAQQHYATVSRADLVALLGPNPPRRPRILCLTTRFSTVVQHVCRDLAAAFAALGWDAPVVIERYPHQRVTLLTLQREIERYRPDLVFAVNHVRAEVGQAIPPNLPHLCWIQDHMPRLMRVQTGAALGPRDFVFLEAPDQYIERFDYPRRQCVALTKLTRPVARPARWAADGEDLVFVSHASAQPEQIVEKLRQRQAACPEVQTLVLECARELLERYRAGECCATTADMSAIMYYAARRLRLPLPATGEYDTILQELYVALNNPLYRQQALGWAASVAGRLGLRLGLYGAGWEQHARFAAFARGPVAYGPALEELTRRSRISLQIVPYAFYHQRLFDGLMAGGFFLIRRNPVDAQHTANLKGLGLIAEDFPALEEVCFDDAASLERVVTRFVGDAELRRSIAARQREFVEKYCTYPAGARRMVAAVRERLAQEGGA